MRATAWWVRKKGLEKNGFAKDERRKREGVERGKEKERENM